MLLPLELVHKIINYTGVVTFYKGKYYNRIPKDDPRYNMLKNIIKLPHIQHQLHYLNDTSYRVVKKTINLKKDIGESYNTPRFKLIYSTHNNDEKLEIYKCGRTKSYSEYYVLSKENKWMKTRGIMHYYSFIA
jgi:hypothetical protein